jgi:hypothetical protein
MAPLLFLSGTSLTTPVAGAVEYNGTDLFFTTGTVRGNIIVGLAGSAPSTSATPNFTSYYGGNTNALGDPVGWIDVYIAGTKRKIPYY